ncbi:MAG TPA: DNA replication and repair protein RecF, partial [Candidatus Saccharimonadales bacterium]|nr:DNA replication and repair protein RecF [Candidatus Saccharimonadales bacterium]
GKSYRAKDQELIHFNKPWARLDTTLNNGSIRTVKLASEKVFTIDDKDYKRLSLDKTLPVVLFEPNHLQLLSGGPERRRDYLDELIEQTTVGYSTIRRQYLRALSQRNNLLKQNYTDRNHIFPWDVKLSQFAGQIIRARLRLVNIINERLNSLYDELSGGKASASLQYLNKWPVDNYETSLLKALEANIELDSLKGFTSLGPHREDFVIKLNKHPTQLTASRGETRTLILTLKIIELSIIEETRNIKPLLLLDDVFSELDQNRRQHLINYLQNHQVFITTTDADLNTSKFAGQTKTIKLK